MQGNDQRTSLRTEKLVPWSGPVSCVGFGPDLDLKALLLELKPCNTVDSDLSNIRKSSQGSLVWHCHPIVHARDLFRMSRDVVLPNFTVDSVVARFRARVL